MAVGKEIRTKIRSIQSTQKITSAMEMVAASKMRRAQERMAASRPYAQKMESVIGHLALAHPEYRHPYLVGREAKRVGLILVSTDRGLCGGLNINLFKAVSRQLKAWQDEGVAFDMVTIGSKGASFFRRVGGRIIGAADHLGDTPTVEALIGSVKIMLDAFDAGELDAIYIAHNTFESTMSQVPGIHRLVPVPPAEDAELKHYWDYIYEPDSKEVLDELLTRYIESLVYQGVVENAACEQASRMVAMKSATDNAGELIDALKLVYNKARQAAITQEISEIVSGAAAV